MLHVAQFRQETHTNVLLKSTEELIELARVASTYGGIYLTHIRNEAEEIVPALEEALRKMTSLPARQLNLQDRGILREGLAADLVAFDDARVQDRATFSNPHQLSEGIEYVVVNGRLVLEKGKHTGARPGRALRRERSITPARSAPSR